MKQPAKIACLASLLGCLVGGGLGGCGAEVPAGGVRAPTEDGAAHDHSSSIPDEVKVQPHRVDAEELLPRDLDFCVRIDLERITATIGPETRNRLSGYFADKTLKTAFDRARSVTIALRFADLEVGDRVVAMEGDFKGVEPDGDIFHELPASNKRVRFFERRDEAPRDGVAAVIVLDERAIVFVSPVEVDSVRRVLRDGPDRERPDPPAEGVVSMHYKPRRLSPSLEHKFPSVSRIIRELLDVKGKLEVPPEGIVADFQLSVVNDLGATHVRNFLEVLRDNTEDGGISSLLKGVDADVTGTALHVRWTISPEIVRRFLQREEPSAPRANRKNGG